jgi:hypothetical protein
VLLIGEDIDGEGQPTPRQDRHETVVAERTDQTIDRHRREVADHRTPFQTETAMGGQQGIAGHCGSHLAIAQDEVRENREHGFACGTLETPDGETAQADTGIMGVACQVPALTAAGLVGELKAKREEKGEHAFDKRLAIAKQLIVGRVVAKIDRDGPVVAGLAGGVAHGSSSGQRVGAADDPAWGNACPMARRWGRHRGVTTQLGEM